MFFEIRATPKQQNKFLKKTQTLKQVPASWEDFVRLTQIRSGGRMVQFVPFAYQKILTRLMDEYANIVIVKSRQLGITQTAASKFLHKASLNPAYSSMCFMRNEEDAGALSRRTRQMVNCLEEYIKPDSDNVGFLKIRGQGEIYFKNSSTEGSRSYDSVQDFLFDECAFSRNIGQIYAASSPSTALSGDNITKLIVSTPSAKSGWYWDKLNENNDGRDIEQLCIDVAEQKIYTELPGLYWFVDKAGTVKMIIHWRCHEIFGQRNDYLEYRQQQDGTDWETILREYDLRFIDSSVAVFTSSLVHLGAIGEYESDVDPDADYYLGIDTATTGNDFLCVPVLKFKAGKYSLVFLYRKNHETNQVHLYKIGELIRRYRPKSIGIEVNGAGQVYFEQLVEEFPAYNIEAIRTTGDSKPVLIYQLVLALEKEILDYPAKSPVVNELLSFRRDGHKLQAAEGKNDDTVMGLAFALNVSPFKFERQNHFDWEKIQSLGEN
ncbi:terminase large subunit domain-containing protein [Scytonema sp. PCC 10023]|uniref:terminase large subunit domain-containing protein n=1 Tax=Scytonema sp. PCC 10023 TaxID=1680591 RepID=UPI0039C5B5ED